MSKLGADIEITLPATTTTGETSIKLNGMEIKQHCSGFSIATTPFGSTIVTLALYGDVKLKAHADQLKAVGFEIGDTFCRSEYPHQPKMTQQAIDALSEAVAASVAKVLEDKPKDTE